MFRALGGLDESTTSRNSLMSSDPEGVTFTADFGVTSFSSTSETKVNEFPELEIFEGSRLRSFILGTFDGSVTCHLRPQLLSNGLKSSSSGPNVFNPLEAYELDFSGSTVALRLKEASFNLVRIRRHRAIQCESVKTIIDSSVCVAVIRIIAELLCLRRLLLPLTCNIVLST